MHKISLAVALLAGAVSAQSTILETAQRDGRFSTLVAALGASSAIEVLRGDGPFTVFAPTDDAFAKLGKEAVAGLLDKKNRAALDDVLTYHVASGSYRAADLTQRSGLGMANGQSVALRTHGETLRVDRATVVLADIRCSNGVIHVIDGVLTPESRALPEIADRRYFGTLLAAVEAAGLTKTLRGDGPFTILAPTDEAFAALPDGTVEELLKPANRGRLQDILKYHVIPGRVSAAQAVGAGQAKTLQGSAVGFELARGQLRVQGANVTMTDVDAKNGVVHVIDRVLLPPAPAKPKGRLVIGVQIATPGEALAAQLHLDRHRTLVVDEVTKGSFAEKAGLRRYDVIAAVDGGAATSDSLGRAKQQAGYGGEITLDIIRRGERLQVPVTVGVDGD